jgi:hypothetical protein
VHPEGLGKLKKFIHLIGSHKLNIPGHMLLWVFSVTPCIYGNSSTLLSSILKMEAACASKLLATLTTSTQCKDLNHQQWFLEYFILHTLIRELH